MIWIHGIRVARGEALLVPLVPHSKLCMKGKLGRHQKYGPRKANFRTNQAA